MIDDDDELIETDCQEQFLALFGRMVSDGLPVMIVTRAFLTTSMGAFRQYIADDDLTKIPTLLRRYAKVIEQNMNGRKR